MNFFQKIGAIFSRASKEPSSPAPERFWTPSLTPAGVRINEESALASSTVWAATRYLSQTVASLPWRVMREIPGGGEVTPKHPVDRILHIRASAEQSPFQFRETLTHWALRYGNGIAEIEPDQVGRPFALHPIHPNRVEFCRADQDGYDSYGDIIPAGDLYYEINNGTSGRAALSAKRVFHIRGFGDGAVGVNMMTYAAQTIGWARAAQLFGSSFFGQGMNLGGVITNKVALSRAALDIQKAEFDNLYRGLRNAHKTVHLDADATFTPFSPKLADSQFVEIHQHLVEEICRFFGVPPHKVGHLLRATFSNIEHQSIEVVQDSITPWVRRFEEEADYKLLGPTYRGYFSKINLRGLLRGDFKSQNEGLDIARRNGVISADEWRGLLDMPPAPAGSGGDKLLVQAAQIELRNVGLNFVQAPAVSEAVAADT